MPKFKRMRRAAKQRAEEAAATCPHGADGRDCEEGCVCPCRNVSSEVLPAEGVPEPESAEAEARSKELNAATSEAEDSEPAAPVATSADDEPTSTEPSAAPDQAISGAGPDADIDVFAGGVTAPWGTEGFTLIQHVTCMSPEQYGDYYRRGPGVLPEACCKGHPLC